MRSVLLIVLLIVIIPIAVGQDSSTVLTHDQFIEQVMSHHPMVYRADIVERSGEAKVRAARGNFDPKLFGDIGQKYFNDQQYYSEMQGGIKVPTWFGLSAEAGYEQNTGVYLNPNRNVPDAGLWYAGLRLDLGNGLIMNQRRSELEKAKIFEEETELQRTILRNQLHYDASNAYWKWAFAFEKVKLYEEAVSNARVRFNGVKQSAIYGDKPYIDTVEAFILVQNRKLALQDATTQFLNAEQYLELFLWDQGLIPIELEGMIPEQSDEVAITIVGVDSPAVDDHPYLQLNRLKQESNAVTLQLKREQLKPDITLKYNALNEPIGSDPFAGYTVANYTWGASFSYPILTRKARGEVQQAKLKMEDQKYAIRYLEEKLKNGIEVARNNLDLADQQLQTSISLKESTEQLFNAEQALFGLGESSVFMINTRENSFLKASIQWIEAKQQLKMEENNYQLSGLMLE